MTNPCIITVAITGALHTKADCPGVPVTPSEQIESTHEAYESLASLTAPNSALVSIENARKLLFSISNEDSGPLFETIEKTHELLNTVEESLNHCARSIDRSSNSLTSTLEKMQFPISIEEVDGIIADWNALARKHGISVCLCIRIIYHTYKADTNHILSLYSRTLYQTVIRQ